MTQNKDDCKHYFSYSMVLNCSRCLDCGIKERDFVRQQTAQEIFKEIEENELIDLFKPHLWKKIKQKYLGDKQ